MEGESLYINNEFIMNNIIYFYENNSKIYFIDKYNDLYKMKEPYNGEYIKIKSNIIKILGINKRLVILNAYNELEIYDKKIQTKFLIDDINDVLDFIIIDEIKICYTTLNKELYYWYDGTKYLIDKDVLSVVKLDFKIVYNCTNGKLYEIKISHDGTISDKKDFIQINLNHINKATKIVSIYNSKKRPVLGCYINGNYISSDSIIKYERMTNDIHRENIDNINGNIKCINLYRYESLLGHSLCILIQTNNNKYYLWSVYDCCPIIINHDIKKYRDDNHGTIYSKIDEYYSNNISSIEFRK